MILEGVENSQILRMILSENRFPSPIGVEDMLFGIMRGGNLAPMNATPQPLERCHLRMIRSEKPGSHAGSALFDDGLAGGGPAHAPLPVQQKEAGSDHHCRHRTR